VFVVYALAPAKTVTDSFWVLPTAKSILAEHNADLDEYRYLPERLQRWQTSERDGHLYYDVPFGVAAVSLPFVALGTAIDAVAGTQLTTIDATPPTLDPIIASLFTAACALVVYLLALEQLGRVKPALAAMVVFAFATPAVSTTSRALWMHGPSMLAVAITLYLLLRARSDDRTNLLTAAGAVIAAAYFIRPTNSVSVIAFTVYVVATYRRDAWRWLVGLVATSAVFVAINLTLYGMVLQPYFRASRLAFSSQVPEALAGNLISPARGLFVYCPFLLAGAWIVVGKVRTRTLTSLDATLLAILAGHWLAVSLFPHWWGGWSYGPRFMSDVMPLAMWFVIPAISELSSPESRRHHPALAGLFALAIVWSVLVNSLAALDSAGFAWNVEPHIDLHPERIWDWSDAPFLTFFRR
jgi:hypothetical protein